MSGHISFIVRDRACFCIRATSKLLTMFVMALSMGDQHARKELTYGGTADTQAAISKR